MRRLLRSKKGFDNFSILLTIFALIALTLILAGITVKYNNLSRTFGGAGSNAVAVLGAYDAAGNALIYLDSAAQVSIEHAAQDTAQAGFYSAAAENDRGYAYWSIGTANRNGDECIPWLTKKIPQSHNIFNGYLSLELNTHIREYNQKASIPLVQSNYEFSLSPVSGGTEVIGHASIPLSVEGKNIDYRVKPNFREWIDLDLIGDFGKITEKARELVATDDTKLVRSDIQDAIKEYNGEESGMGWAVSFDSVCSNQCGLGKSCYQCWCDWQEVEVEYCSTNPETEESECDTVTETVCNRICDIPGELAQLYCSENAKVSVKVKDDAYRSESNKDGYRGFISASGFTPYEYRFDLNWVEMKDVQCCSGGSCTSDYSDVLISGAQ